MKGEILSRFKKLKQAMNKISKDEDVIYCDDNDEEVINELAKKYPNSIIYYDLDILD